MCRFHRAAKRVIAGAGTLIASLLLPVGCNPAWAQADPFELPAGVNAETISRSGTPGLSEIVVDGRHRSRMVFLEWLPSGRLAIDCDDARSAGIDVPASLKGRVPLDTLPIAASSFDGATQTLTVSLLRKSDGGNLIDLGRRQATDGDSGALTWARVGYDVVGTASTRNPAAVAGLFDLSVGRGNFIAGSSVSVFVDHGSIRTRRLSSAAQLFIPGRSLVATFGDMISVGSSSQRAVRLGGVAIASDVTLRPDLVTLPLPSFSGRVAVPTTIDIISGGQRTEVGQVKPGEFTVRNVPVASGRGEASIVIRDELGRESVQKLRFYSSPEMLPQGINQFGASMGWVRRRYGEDHDTYGQFAATGFYRRGLSPGVTLTVSGETAGGMVNAGTRIDAALGGVALATVETRLSRGPNGSGGQISAAIESSGGGFSGRMAVVWPTNGFRDVASVLGDPLPTRSVTAFAGYNRSRSAFQLSGGIVWNLRDPLRGTTAFRSIFVDGSVRYEASQRLSFSTAVTYRHGDSNNFAATFGMTLRLGRQGWAGSSLTHRTGYPFIASASYRQMPSASSPIGYYGAAEYGRSGRLDAGVTWRNRAVETEAKAEYENGDAALRLNARGALILAGGNVFARSRADGTYALVRTGRVGGLTVRYNNQPVGRTGKRGTMLVDNVIPYVASNYEIDADKIPSDVLAKVYERRMVVPRRTVGLVTLTAVRFIPHPVKLVDAMGNPLEMGTHMTARPSGDDLVVGFDGFVETNGAGPDRALEVDLGARGFCRFTLPPPISQLVQEDAPIIGCRLGIPPAQMPIALRGDEHRRAQRNH